MKSSKLSGDDGKHKTFNPYQLTKKIGLKILFRYMHWEVMRINREIISRRQSRDSQGGLLSNIHGRISFGRHSRSDAVLNRRDTVDTTAYLQPVIEQE